MPTTSAPIAATTDKPGGILATQNIIGDPPLAEVILPGKTKSPADYAYARLRQGGVEHGSVLHGVLMQILSGNNFSHDTMMADATGIDTVANNTGDAANGATVVKNPINNHYYGYTTYAKDETSEEVSTPLAGAGRVLSQADAKRGPTGGAPVAALDSHYNREVVPTPSYASGAAGQTVAASVGDDMTDPASEEVKSGNQYEDAGFSGSAITSGGRYSGYGFNHFYGRNRSNSQPRGDDGIAAPVSNIDQYLSAIYGAMPFAEMQPRGSEKIDNPGGHRSAGTGQPR